MGMMYTRSITAPAKSFFLFGPRGTGKSSWIYNRFSNAYIIDLLLSDKVLQYQKNPNLLQGEVKARPKNQWIVIDEVQKVPELLDEVHYLMEREGYKKFILSGSSARKLKRSGVNLLAGRAFIKKMFPLTSKETNFSVPVKQSMTFGMLPLSVTTKNDGLREEYLKSYIETYLKEEIKYESLVRNIGAFARFLEISSLVAGTSLNVSGLARDSGIGRDTARSYFSVFEDTLLGAWLPAFKPRAKVKEVSGPKFYWFDPGVLHAAAGGFQQPRPSDWDGILFEHLIFHELTAFLEYSKTKGSLGYWSTPNVSEIDFLWWYGTKYVAVEVKASKVFHSSFLKGIKSFSESKTLNRSFVVYLGDRELKVGNTWVLPAMTFLRKLHQGEVLG